MICSREEAFLVFRGWEAQSTNVLCVFFLPDRQSRTSFVATVSVPSGEASVMVSEGEDSDLVDLSGAQFGFETAQAVPAEFRTAKTESRLDSAVFARLRDGTLFAFFAAL
jgi:hypothetical protein